MADPRIGSSLPASLTSPSGHHPGVLGWIGRRVIDSSRAPAILRPNVCRSRVHSRYIISAIEVLMRRANFLAFDEYISAGTTGLAPQFTTAELNTKLAQFDQLAIQVVIDNVTGNPIGSFDLYIEHSADGR